MRVGLFTDSYRPSINGIVYVIDSTRAHLEALGHEVFVVTTGGPLSRLYTKAKSKVRSAWTGADDVEIEVDADDDHLIRLRSFRGAFFEDYYTSVFFQPALVRSLRKLELDVIHTYTPGQIGFVGTYFARKEGKVLVSQYSTDVYHYIEHYPMVFPGLLALTAMLGQAIKPTLAEARTMAALYRPQRSITAWGQDIIRTNVNLIGTRSDIVIALSPKSKTLLESFQSPSSRHEITLLPNGVDALPPASPQDVDAFRRMWDIAEDDEVIGFVGRLGAEKNSELLIPALEHVLRVRPHARLLFIGDFKHRAELEEITAGSVDPSRVTFTGFLARETLGAAYAAMDVFVFPSLTDTQGWAVHEAALAGLPLVLIDQELSEVFRPGVNGEAADNSARSVADAVLTILSDPERAARYRLASAEISGAFTEDMQIRKLADLYAEAIDRRHRAGLDHPDTGVDWDPSLLDALAHDDETT